MTIPQRKAEILNNVFQASLANLIENLALLMEEKEALTARVASLEAKCKAAGVATDDGAPTTENKPN